VKRYTVRLLNEILIMQVFTAVFCYKLLDFEGERSIYVAFDF
jgi:hypothetical protein